VDAQLLTVGPIQENCHLVRASKDAGRAVLVDPGEEAPRILRALEATGATLDGILVTHCHFDHIGAVAPVARATGAEVWCPVGETDILADIMSYVPYAGFGPYDSWQAEHPVKGGDRIELAGLTFDVIDTPGHSPGHVTYAVAGEDALFSGDVLFQGSIGRTDLPGGDLGTLLESIGTLLDGFPDETVVHPGHMGLTTLGRERATNPFLQSLAR
jgi:glyoxylase-like metal-dependent hydrolase (beta-lactamase superfamily II)